MGALWGDAFAPITSAIGFLRSDADSTVKALVEWRRRLHPSVEVAELATPMPQALLSLEPLTTRVSPREIVVQTADPQWSAHFTCGLPFPDPMPAASYLSMTMGVQGASVTCIPDNPTATRSLTSGPYGARMFELYSPVPTDFVNTVRSVAVVQDGRRWEFVAAGTPQDFEEPAAYRRLRVRERFTVSMLSRYARAIGVDALSGDFYSGRSLVLTSATGEPGVSLSLEQARRHYGLDR